MSPVIESLLCKDIVLKLHSPFLKLGRLDILSVPDEIRLFCPVCQPPNERCHIWKEAEVAAPINRNSVTYTSEATLCFLLGGLIALVMNVFKNLKLNLSFWCDIGATF